MYRDIKRIFDGIGALVLLLATWPFLLIAAIAIKIEDPKGPIFFKQARPGKDEKVFTIYKLRTMCVDTYNQEGQLLTDVQRMTKVGKLLRKLSLDEFPQFINVLRGEMSFIGPRPLLVQYLPYYTDEQRKRHQVRPGISGWAQVNGRNGIDWETKFQLDLWYVEHMSLKTDMFIIYKTIHNVIKRKNINHNEQDTMPFFQV